MQVEIDALVRWIEGVEFSEWPQQHRLADGQIRPAMVTDLSWHGFGAMTEAVVSELMLGYPGCRARQRMLSVVMPGHSIDRHRDEQPPHWRTRVHVPLVTNPLATFNGEHMAAGRVYEVDTREMHEVRNGGLTPRIHLMFDVVEGK